MLLTVSSAFLPWIEVSIHRTFDPPATISTYALWQLPVWGCFPFLVGLPLAILIWTLLQRQAGRRRIGRARLLLLCLAGAAGAVVFVLLAGYSADPFLPWRGVASSETLLLGGWVCLAGYGMLVAGALLFG